MRGAAAQIARQLGLRAAVHAARGLVQREHGRRLALAAGDDREREALALAAGEVLRVALGHRRQPDGRERRGGRLFGDALVDQVVAGVLQQQRDASGALDAAARRLHQPGGVAQERRLAGAVAAHQRDALAGGDAQVDAAEDRRAVAQLVPDALQTERLRGGLSPPQSPPPAACASLRSNGLPRDLGPVRGFIRDGRRG